ncbi:MAG TPA: RNA polymerase sigma factor [Stellaceae bacterium]|jgi:RNA polymerase sigma-70 factor (ECF subfamily)
MQQQQQADAGAWLGSLTDAELAEQLRRGHAAAFRIVVQRNNRRLYRTARSILRDDGEAEDAVQESYLRAFSSLDGFRGGSSLSTWLTRIVVNEALGRVRRRRPMLDLDEAAEAQGTDMSRVIPFPPSRTAASQDPEHEAATAEIRRVLETAIDELPEGFRTVFVLREIEQMHTSETAACLGIPPDTVRTRLHRAKAMLREALEQRLASVLTDTFPFDGERCARMADRVLARLGLGEEPPAPEER